MARFNGGRLTTAKNSPSREENTASGVWSLNEMSVERASDEWPVGNPLPPAGGEYADSYVATTGGSITTFGSTSGNIDTAVSNLSDGDALLLEAGTYTVNALRSEGYSSDPWRNKNILIAGKSSDANDIVIEVTHAGQRGKHIFSEGDGSQLDPQDPQSPVQTPTINKQMAFLRLKRLATSDANFVNALAGGVAAEEAKGRMINCILDNNAGKVCWLYDNNNSTDTNVKFIRTTFLNYTEWMNSYSGATGIIAVDNCLFTGTTIDGNGRATLTDCVTGATVGLSDGSYVKGDYPTAGHLYIPNRTAVF